MTGAVPLILKLENWPEIDRKLWEMSFMSRGLFDTGGVFAGWSAGTRRLHAQNYGSWLSFIQRTRPGLLKLPPADRITKESVGEYIEEGKQRLKLRSISSQVQTLAVIARGFAPDRDWAWLLHAARSLFEQSNPYQLKPPIPLSASDLFEWSLARLHELEGAAPGDPLIHAMRYRQALTVGLLIARPVRARAFVAMTVDRHLEISDHGMMMHFDARDMKDRRARRFPFPEPLAPFMQRYLALHRPVLLQGHEVSALWISQRGNSLSQDSFTSGLAQLTERVFGIRLRPHAFRHIAATSIATYAPEHVGIIRDILGHATLRTAERHYNRATAVEASRRLQLVLRDLRRDGRKARRNQHRRRRAGGSD